MVSRTILLCLAAALFVALAGCGKSSSNMVADGVEAKVIKIERGSTITIGSATAVANRGEDVVRVLFEIKASGNVKELKLKADEQQLIDADGKSYKAYADLGFTFGSGGGTMSMDSLFDVPQGATLKTFKLGRASFDISGMEGAKPGTSSKR